MELFAILLWLTVPITGLVPDGRHNMRASTPKVTTQAHGNHRRDFFCTLATAALLNLSGNVKPALAGDDRLFRPNPLTNPVLEQIRIWEQAEADELQYGGELADSNKRQDSYARLLVPILVIARDLNRVEELVRSDDREKWQRAQLILSSTEKYDKINFKKIFNKFGDNIYYSDPDRANLYLGGGATPKTEQSVAYLLRNEILTAIEDLQAELAFLAKDTQEDGGELRSISQRACASMERYLAIVPPDELSSAKKLLDSQELSK